MKAFGLLLALGVGAATATPHPRLSHATILSPRAAAATTEYDYIIIGGGTAGLVVADRLTASSNTTTVLVLEHGALSNASNIAQVRGGMGGLMDRSLQFDITSVPQVNLRNRTASVQVGKVVGGSSAVNAMMVIRGTREDYDRWGGLFGFPAGEKGGWGWEGLLPYFRRAMRFVPPGEEVAREAGIKWDAKWWGADGEVVVGWPSYQFPATGVLMEAWRGMGEGVRFPEDSGAGETGVYWYPTFMDPVAVVRSYAKTGHVDGKAGVRANYVVVPGAKVTRVVVEGGRAVGVEWVPAPARGAGSAGVVTTVRARREVVLAAGAVHTPQILQLSGVGPRGVLEAAGVKVVVELPGVGQNFQDHTSISAGFNFRNIPNPQTNASFNAWSSAAWAANRTGPNSIATGNAAAWLSYPVISTRSAALAAALLAQNHSAHLPADTHPTVQAGYAAQMRSLAAALQSNGTAFYNLVQTGSGSTGMLVDLHPLSRGTVNIDARDPANREPLVDYRALSNPLDAVIMGDIVRYTRRYALDNPSTKALAPSESAPGARVQTDEEFAEWLKGSVSPTYFHPVGTASMMPRELGGVVDQELRVYGVEGLRVVDASVIPVIPGANTCQTVYAIAEKAADLIKAAM
ncbi:putative GMC oxidoreductase [Podospora conica]|nr:putative GMC oxidoreductase [Schizothecium conicum]